MNRDKVNKEKYDMYKDVLSGKRRGGKYGGEFFYVNNYTTNVIETQDGKISPALGVSVEHLAPLIAQKIKEYNAGNIVDDEKKRKKGERKVTNENKKQKIDSDLAYFLLNGK